MSGSLLSVPSLGSCPVLMCQFWFYLILYYYYLLGDCCFLMRDRKEMYLGGRGGEEELGGIDGTEPYQDVLCEKTIYFQ